MGKSAKTTRYGIFDETGVCRLPVHIADPKGGAPKGNRNARYRQMPKEAKRMAARVDSLLGRIALTLAAADEEIARRKAARLRK